MLSTFLATPTPRIAKAPIISNACKGVTRVHKYSCTCFIRFSLPQFHGHFHKRGWRSLSIGITCLVFLPHYFSMYWGQGRYSPEVMSGQVSLLDAPSKCSVCLAGSLLAVEACTHIVTREVGVPASVHLWCTPTVTLCRGGTCINRHSPFVIGSWQGNLYIVAAKPRLAASQHLINRRGDNVLAPVP
ncbi:hypothetical protein BDZ91DRAFT_400235 [Kalaharituber pfeilii]|nr:hypothetical protein BDZ91DRAFT_400235 [Kalaharituber pfeilii]